MRAFRSLAPIAAGLALALAVIGSWIRINGAGMTCPDWPLCHGAIVPVLSGGVVLEWSHRALALLETFVVLATIIAGWRVRGQIAGLSPALRALGVIFAVQVFLGGATVHLSNSPLSVMLHWGMAMALLATLCVVALLALLAPPAVAFHARLNPPASALRATVFLAFVTMCIGSYVSSSYAGLACLTFPDCDGTLFGHSPAQFMQMLHRIGALAFALTAIGATISAAQFASQRARATATAGLVLVAVQIALGAANVLLRLPTLLREAHAVNAALTFVCFVIAAAFATLDPLREPVQERAHSGVSAQTAPSV
ncbi:MAG TPA: COX15/CtaA family protein [Candidatus Baltobacteraceae bacterium]